MTKRTAFDTTWLDDVLREQQGLITSAQLTRMGVSGSTVTGWIGPGGRWQRLLPGVYLCHPGSPTSRQRQCAALLYVGPSGVITGSEVLRLRKFRNAPTDTQIRVLVPNEKHRSSSEFVTVERTHRLPQPVLIGGLPFAPVQRAVMDVCRQLADLRTVRGVILEAVQRELCTLDELAQELAEGPMRGSARPRLALAEAGAGLRSPAEVDLRDVFAAAGLPTPLWNTPLYLPDGNILAIPDAYYPDAGLAIEVDSREYHFSAADWERTMRRHDRMVANGVIVIHVSPRRIRTEGSTVAAEVADALRNCQGRPQPPVTTEASPTTTTTPNGRVSHPV